MVNSEVDDDTWLFNFISVAFSLFKYVQIFWGFQRDATLPLFFIYKH